MLFARIYKYNYEVSSIDILKLIAIITMIIDHIGFYFLEHSSHCFVIGRLAAPLFFFITGYVSVYKFKPVLLLGGIILTGTNFYFEEGPINILINFMLIKWVLDKWDPCQTTIFRLILMVIWLLTLAYLWGDVILLEYDTLGLAYAICGRLQAGNSHRNWISLFLASTLLIHFYQGLLWLEFKGEYNIIQSLLLILFIWLFFVMFLFRYQIFKFSAKIKDIILVLSRYSLEIYFLHYLIFQLVWFYGLPQIE